MSPDRPTTSLGRLPLWLILTTTFLGLAWIGYWRMFSHFPGFDDEGYILLSVRDYLRHGDLYGTVYSQYGPAFYALMDGIHALLGGNFGHAFARWFTLTCWLMGAAGCLAIAWRLSRSWAAAWFSGIASFLYLYQFSEEAFHPASVIIAVMPFSLYGILVLQDQGRRGWGVALAGAACAVLSLTKINVGVLFAVGWGVWFLLTSPAGRWARLGGLFLGVGFSAALMASLRQEPWIQIYLAMVSIGLVGIAGVAGDRPRYRWIEVAAGFLGAGVMTLAVLALIHGRGTSWPMLWEGIVLGPLRHPQSYSFAIDWRPGTLVGGAAAVGLLVWFVRLQKQARVEEAARLLTVLRLIHLAGLAVALAMLEHFRVVGALFSYSLPWFWLWVPALPRAANSRESGTGREFLACILALQTLHAYPVGGIQLCWGIFLLFALVAPAIRETGEWLHQQGPALRRFAAVPVAFMAVAIGGKAMVTAWEYHAEYAANVPLNLPGSAGLRLNEREVAAYQSLATNTVLHADQLFSMPGMFSFNMWSEVPTPTAFNTSLWYTLLKEAQQEQVVAALKAAKRPVFVVNDGLVAVLNKGKAPLKGPGWDYMVSQYQSVFGFQGLSFWVQRGRSIAPVGTAWSRAGIPAFDVWVMSDGAPIASLEIVAPEASGMPPLQIDARNSRVIMEPVMPDARPRGDKVEMTWPLQITGIARLRVECPTFRLATDQSQVVRMKSADGTVLMRAHFVDQR